MATGQSGHVDPEAATAIAGAGGKAAGDAAEQGKDTTEAQAATQAAMEAEAERQGVTISPEDIKAIAEGTIGLLEQRGAFEQAPDPGQSPPPTEPPNDSSTSGSESAASPAATPPPAPSGEGENSPRKRTFAERFMGKA